MFEFFISKPLNLLCFNRALPEIQPLEIGENDYNGTKVKVEPIITTLNGLCYKFNMSDPLPYHDTAIFIIGTSNLGVDKLKGVNLFMASEGTWQGAVIDIWPYSKIPLKTGAIFSTDSINVINVNIEENVWNYRDGEVYHFDDCMSNEHIEKCKSIFDPTPFANMYVNYKDS